MVYNQLQRPYGSDGDDDDDDNDDDDDDDHIEGVSQPQRNRSD
jgi:hypothetical protein